MSTRRRQRRLRQKRDISTRRRQRREPTCHHLDLLGGMNYTLETSLEYKAETFYN